VAEPKFSSSPGPTEIRGYNPGTTAFQSMAAGVIGGSIGQNRWTNADDPYMKFLYAADSTAKDAAFQNIFRGLVDQQDPTGKYRNMWEYVQATMRNMKMSSAKTTLGVPDSKDMAALENVIRGAIGSNATDPIAWLTAASMGYSGGKTITQPDTTPKFNRQINKTLQLIDWTDAKSKIYDLYYTAFGTAPSDDLIGKLENQWNVEVKKQTPPTVTEGKTTFTPVYDKSKPIFDKTKPVLTKGGKPKKDAKGNIIYQQKVDKNGNPLFEQKKNKEGILQYETKYATTTSQEGEGFTNEEQAQFLTDFLKANFPQADFNAEEVGGAAKSIYDDLVAVHRNNYSTAPGFDKLGGVILDIIGSADEKVAAEKLRAYKDNIRKETGKRYMSIAEDLAAGKDARELIGNALNMATNYLETTLTEDDSLMKKILNFKDDKGNYRMPNDLEMYELLDNDPRAAYTSRKKNEAISMAQTLRSRLQR
jgi:hypothetical protein